MSALDIDNWSVDWAWSLPLIVSSFVLAVAFVALLGPGVRFDGASGR